MSLSNRAVSSRARVLARVLSVAVLLAMAQVSWSHDKPSSPQVQAEGVENFGRVTDLLYRGAQPTQVGFNTLRHMGVAIVVNFRDEGDNAAEKRAVESLGMKYVSIPWSALENPSDAQVVQFLDLVRDNPQAKIFVHCRRGADRTGTMIAAYRVAIEHKAPEEAVAEMYQYHYAHFFLPHLQRFITSLQHTLQTDATYSAYAPVAHPPAVLAPASVAAAAIVGVPSAVQ